MKNHFLICLIYLYFIQIKDSIFNIECNDKCANSAKHPPNNCICANDCYFYNDCCSDANKPNSNVEILKNIDCNLKLSNNKWIYAINKCKIHNQNIIEKCERNQNNLINLIPVYYRNQTFKNIYCLLCNFDQQFVDEDIQFYEINMNDQINLTEQMNLTNLTQLILFNQNSDDLSFDLPNMKHRYCMKSISTCSSNASDYEHNLCTNSSTSYRYYLNDESHYQIYKNEHCAKCNGINLDQLRCQMMRPRFFYQNLQILFDLKNLNGDLKIELNIRSSSEYSTINKSIIISEELYMNLSMKSSINAIKNIITFVGQITSMISLALLLSIYFTNRKLRNLGGKILISLCISLLLSQIMFLVSGLSNDLKKNQKFCFNWFINSLFLFGIFLLDKCDVLRFVHHVQ
jgi:hypothetical protein